jgi:hypothetical protein
MACERVDKLSHAYPLIRAAGGNKFELVHYWYCKEAESSRGDNLSERQSSTFVQVRTKYFKCTIPLLLSFVIHPFCCEVVSNVSSVGTPHSGHLLMIINIIVTASDALKIS